jgi:allophanate hydrolase subunit 1
MMALDPRCRLSAPKYNPARTWTPQGTVGMGGASTAIYPVATPGGYQIFARTPVPIWDPEQRFPVFRDSIVLFRAGGRVRFVPVESEEFDWVEARCVKELRVQRRRVSEVLGETVQEWIGGLERRPAADEVC